MGEDGPLFVLAGNGPYENRGCEAIVRGTTRILREYFRDPRFICISHFQNEEQYREQCLQETDKAITHLSSYRLNKRNALRGFWKPGTWSYVYRLFFDPVALKYQVYQDMLPHLDDAVAVLSIGGDNYSLDYGVPTLFTDLDDIVLQKGKPIFLWGASVGPFSAMPDYERYMSDHLQKVTGIFTRESVTIDYLSNIGVTRNVYQCADPAFLMDPVGPKGIEDVLSLGEEAIGLNLSPLMAKFVTSGDLNAWTRMAAEIISGVAEATEMPIYLIPHVTSPHSDDYTFMQNVVSQISGGKGNFTLLPPTYTAAETKWIISRMALFAGARTHSTIAALSSGVPTLSFAYSIKAQGINKDIFGHTEYCLEAGDLDARVVSSRVVSILDENTAIRNDLAERIPTVQRAALSAGMELKHLVGEN